MTRIEARNKALWNTLPKQIRTDITKNVEWGYFLKIYYKSDNIKLDLIFFYVFFYFLYCYVV